MPKLALASPPGPTVTAAHAPASACATTVTRPATPDRILAAVKDAQDPVPTLKWQLARAILDRLEGSGQLNLAHRLGVDQPRASNLSCGRLERFSLQRLVRFAARVDGEVTISVTWTSRTIWVIPRTGAGLGPEQVTVGELVRLQTRR
jgi:predicted XRE-type DNA-binding protein